MRSLYPTEHQIQCAIVEWCSKKWVKYFFDSDLFIEGYLNAFMFSVPNGGHRHILTAIKLKKEGQKSGMPDLGLFLPSFDRKYKFAWFEVKTSKGKLSKTQKSMISILQFVDNKVYIVRSLDEFIQAIKDYLGMR